MRPPTRKIEDADGFVFEDDGMVLRGGSDGVQVVGPDLLGWGRGHGLRFVGNCCRLKGMGTSWIACALTKKQMAEYSHRA